MSDHDERRDATQQEAGSAQDETEGTVEATEAAERTESRMEASEAAKRKARALGVDLNDVKGTGSGGSITAPDVVKYHQQQSDTTPGSMETLQRRVSDSGGGGDPKDNIQRQYVVLKATLAGPRDGTIPLRIVKEDGSAEDPITDVTFLDNPFNFFAPEPLPVKWTLPSPQPLLPNPLPGTDQPCREEQCLRGHEEG